MYTYCRKMGNRIFLREESGDPQTITKFSCDVYYPLTDESEAKYHSIYGKPLYKESFPSLKEAHDNLTEIENHITVYGAKNFGYQYIRDKFLGKTPITPDMIYIANIDIETARDNKGYSPAKIARCPITAITLHNIAEDMYTVWGYHADGYIPTKNNVRYISCSSEIDMLYKFVGFISCNYPHIITGWNSNLYDIPYIVNRINRMFNDDGITSAKLSPYGQVYAKDVKTAYGKHQQTYDIVGISCIDYMDLFKKFTYKKPENYKLDTVAHMILGDRKVDYSEYKNLQELYVKNFKKFIDYNIKDVNIVTRLDEKLNLFNLVLSLAYKVGVNFADVVSPVTTWDIFIYNAIMDKNMIPPIKMDDAEAGKYIGAFVKEPIIGMYKWLISCDLNSLYPHIQMGYNISPEKRVSEKNLPQALLDIKNKLIEETELSFTPFIEKRHSFNVFDAIDDILDDDFEYNYGEESEGSPEVLNGIQHLLDESIDLSILDEYNVCITPNGQFYRRDEDGFIPVILSGLYNERKAVKKSMIDDKKSMERDSSLNLTNTIAVKDTLQMALKILMNSEYGALGNQYFRYFDLRNAEAVTSSGQLAILWVQKHLNIFFNRILKTEGIDYVVYADTDSVYLNLEPIVEKFITDTDKNKIVDILDGWAKKVLQPEINNIYSRLAKYTNAHREKMVMAREVIADRGFWTGKKRYALNVYDNEGVRYAKPKTKIMGLECVRSSTPEFCRTYIKESIVKILTGEERTVQKYIDETKDLFMEQPPEDISFPRGVNDMEKWTSEKGLPLKGCPIAVKGAIIYNLFLKNNELTDEEIQSGDKIKFTYLKQPNIFRSPVLSYPPAMASLVYENLSKYIDREKQWNGTFYDPVNKIMKTVGWNGTKVNSIFDFC